MASAALVGRAQRSKPPGSSLRSTAATTSAVHHVRRRPLNSAPRLRRGRSRPDPSTAPAQSPQYRLQPAELARPLPRKRRGFGLCPGSRCPRHPLESGHWGRPCSASKVGVDGASQSQGGRAKEPESRGAQRECGHATMPGPPAPHVDSPHWAARTPSDQAALGGRGSPARELLQSPCSRPFYNRSAESENLLIS